jgi:hypothetical protein
VLWGCLSHLPANSRTAGDLAPCRRSPGSVTAAGPMCPSEPMSCLLRASAGSLLTS